MDQNNIIALLGFIISSVTAIIVAVIQSTRKINFLKLLFVFLIIVALIMLSLFIYFQFGPKPQPQIRIINPVDNEIVEKTITVKGSYKNIPISNKIWIFIYPLKVNRYFPQNNPAELEADNKWSSLVYIGQDNDIGQGFNICAVLIDSNARIIIDDYLKTARDKENSPGLENLPEGAIKYQTIAVKRK